MSEARSTVSPYQIAVEDAVLDDLRDRLEGTRWTDAVASGWDYGTDEEYLRELVAYWRDTFDWRAQEAELNQLDNFRAVVDGVGIHFVHRRSSTPGATALLLMHGWPSSFIQMRKIMPLLEDYHLIVPSLPGYGFSDRPTEPGMTVGRIAELFTALMRDNLGYDRYAIRASDLAAGIAPLMAMRDPDAVTALHMSGSNVSADYSQVPDDLSAAEQTMVEQARAFQEQEFAYGRLHSTKPQTVAFGLNDSPVGLASWVVEKFRAWSDCHGDVETRFSKDELLTNLTIYWATQTIGSSMRLYWESAHNPPQWGQMRAPVGMAMLPADMYRTPREWVERQGGPVFRWTELPRGGHFAEWEEPELIAEDIRAFLTDVAKS